jgi:hypothetical protein
MDSPFTRVDFDTWRYRVSAGGASLDVDLTALAALTGADVPEPTSTTTSTIMSSSSTTAGEGDPAVSPDPAGLAAAATGAATAPRFTG